MVSKCPGTSFPVVKHKYYDIAVIELVKLYGLNAFIPPPKHGGGVSRVKLRTPFIKTVKINLFT